MIKNLEVTDNRLLHNMLLDIMSFILIFYITSFSHLIAFPLYYFDPIRFFILIAIVYSNRKNAFFLTLALPLFTFITTSHPVFYKALLISSELLINSILFYFINHKYKNFFISIISSIILSKIWYYLIKAVIINQGLINSNLISTDIIYQLFTLFVFAFLFNYLNKKRIYS